MYDMYKIYIMNMNEYEMKDYNEDEMNKYGYTPHKKSGSY